jgi:uncharacterized metal-binding protein YceD (DUF177 family)
MERRLEIPPPEFSRAVSVAGLGDEVAVHRIAATEDERTALARRFGLIALDRFAAEVRLSREGSGSVRLEAEIAAEVVQECVATLEPFSSHVADRFAVVYRRPPARPSQAVALEVDEDDVETLTGDDIDVGEAVAQQLSLALDPFPRSPAAPPLATELTAEAGGAAAAPPHPFAALAKLVKK